MPTYSLQELFITTECRGKLFLFTTLFTFSKHTTMKHFILLLTFSILSTFIYSQSNTNTTCGCIEILFTNSPQELKPEHFAFTTDVPVVEIQPDKLTKVLFCYNNYNKALFLLNTFTKYYPKATIIEKKSIQIESLPKLFATIQ